MSKPAHDWPIDKGLTTRQLAEALGVKPSSILVSKAQNGGRYRGLLPKRLKNGHLRCPPIRWHASSAGRRTSPTTG